MRMKPANKYEEIPDDSPDDLTMILLFGVPTVIVCIFLLKMIN